MISNWLTMQFVYTYHAYLLNSKKSQLSCFKFLYMFHFCFFKVRLLINEFLYVNILSQVFYRTLSQKRVCQKVILIIPLCLCFVQFCTIPLDTAKVRLQLQKKVGIDDGVGLPKYKGLLGTVKTIAREEGISALWKGIVPGLHRQCLYGGLRIGLYDPVSINI